MTFTDTAPWFAARRILLVAATERPWKWEDGGETTGWCDEDQVIRYRHLRSPGRGVLNHAQTWQIRDVEAELLVAAVNDYELLLDIAEAAEALIDRTIVDLTEVGKRELRLSQLLHQARSRAANSQAGPDK